MAKIALQLNSVDMFSEPGQFLSNFEQCLQMGYEGVEFYRTYQVPAQELRRRMDAMGISSAGNHIMIDELQDERLMRPLIEEAQTLGSPYLICPRVPENMRGSVDAYRRTADFLDRVVAVCRKEGLYLLYHHHEPELEDLGGICGLDILLENTAPENLGMQAEIFWVEYMKQNQADFLKKYEARCVSMHIADAEMRGDEMIYTDMGDGFVDLDSILACSERQEKISWYVLEQEHYTRRPMMDALSYGCVWLKEHRERVASVR